MAKLSGMLILFAAFSVFFHNGLFLWVGGGFAPLHRPVQRHPAISARSAVKTKMPREPVKVGDRVHYVWVLPSQVGRMDVKLGDYGTVTQMFPDDDTMKVRLEGRHDGQIGYILIPAMHKETRRDEAFRLLDKGNDGTLNRQEAVRFIGSKFDLADLDKDGKLDRGEWNLAKIDDEAIAKIISAF